MVYPEQLPEPRMDAKQLIEDPDGMPGMLLYSKTLRTVL
jgi:hypothetical protein